MELTGSNGWKHVRDEKLGIHECRVFKKSTGSVIRYEWRDVEGGPVRQTILASTRPIKVRYRNNGTCYVRTRGIMLNLDEMFRITPVRLGKRCYDAGESDTMFSGYMIDGESFSESDGEEVYVARYYT